MAPLVPNRFLFTFEFPLAFRKTLPNVDGSLADWTDAELLPALGSIDGRREFAPVWACWNDNGICIACRVTGKKSPLRCDPVSYWKGDNLRICTDTRPASENKRATRFCQQFFFLPAGGNCGESASNSAESNRKSKISERIADRRAPGAHRQCAIAGIGKFQRAREEPPPVPVHLIRVASRVQKDGYSLEAMIPSDCLVGFDPAEHPRIGFYYMLEDTDHGQQYLTVGDDLLWYADPSTWAIAQLSGA